MASFSLEIPPYDRKAYHREHYLKSTHGRERLKYGHRPYQRQQLPQFPPTKEELSWAAGFLEGEGCFSRDSSTKHPRPHIHCHQVNREPVDKLLAFFGGTIYGPYVHRGNIHAWFIRGNRAAAVMRMLEPLMSQRRQMQIRKALGESVQGKLDLGG